ncbi:MAG TPA: hypothetical protein VFG04_05610 [Planctomycetaceae bacterium]|jgi:hypothetical protein|nr:hypothetical protein [Planctomycetaceae bacterium]
MRPLASILVATCMLQTATAGGEPKHNGHSNPEVLRMKVEQVGFAGKTGQLWILDATGAWSVSDFFEKRISPPSRHGRCSPEQINDLRRVLEASRFSDLPASIGAASPVNPQTLEIVVGEKKVICNLEPGKTMQQNRQDLERSMVPPRSPQDLKRLENWDRMIKVEKEIHTLMREPTKPVATSRR